MLSLSVIPRLFLTLLPLSCALRVPITISSVTALTGDARVDVESTTHRLLAGQIDFDTAVKQLTDIKLNSRSPSTPGPEGDDYYLDLDLGAATRHTLDIDAYLRTTLRQALEAQAKADADAKAKGDARLSTRTQVLSMGDVYAGASFCVTLATNLRVSETLYIAAGTCVCVDSTVAGGLFGDIKVVTSSGLTFTGQVAAKIRDSLLFARFRDGFLSVIAGETQIALGLLFGVQVAADVCVQANVFLGIGDHDFNQGTGLQCCARACTGNMVPTGPNGECTCPAANTCQTQCLSGPAIECGGQCYLASQYTCPSGVPVPRANSKKRNLDICLGFGHELCAVAGSKGWECVNTLVDIESCGGCVHDHRGADCTSIPFVDEVLCELGACHVLSCERGYQPSRNGTLCLSIDVDVDLDVDLGAKIKTDSALTAFGIIGTHH